MIQIFLFNEGSRAAAYGIGTYVRQLTSIFRQVQELCFNIVFTRAPKEEFCLEIDGYITFFYIPDVLQDNDSKEKISKYYRNVWYVIRPFLQEYESNKLILHLNYYQHACLVDYFKRDFPEGKCCFTIHYMDWCFKIKGNESWFRKIISSEKGCVQTNTEKEVLEIYEKEKLLFNRIDEIICLSTHTKEIICEQYNISPKKIFVSYNGLEDDLVCIKKEDRIQLKKKIINKNKKIILFVGRLDEIKGVDKLIKSLKEVIITLPNSILILVGDGFYSFYLSEAKGLWKNIIFTGRLDKSELYKLYSIADVGVLPSFHEQCSYVAIEMMMHGIPIIASTSTGLCEMVEEEITGLHIPVVEYHDRTEMDTNLLAEKILFLLNNHSLRRKMELNSRLRYEQTYTLNHMKNGMLSLYTSLCCDKKYD